MEIVNYLDAHADAKLSGCDRYKKLREEATVIINMDLLARIELARSNRLLQTEQLISSNSTEEKKKIIRLIRDTHNAYFEAYSRYSVERFDYQIILINFYMQYLDRGLYLDIKLVMKKGNASDIEELDKCVEAGYSDKYLKDASYLCSEDANQEEDDDDECEDDTDNYYTDEDEKVRFRSMIFEGCGYSGYRFTSGDIDYLNAKVFIEPIKKACTLSVRSQIYDGNEPFSKVFSNEYQLKPGDTWFQTTGWGNKNFYAYENKTYQWRVEFDGKDVYSQDFYFYNGKIKKSGVPVKDVKLFASKASGALEADRDKYSMAFKRESLEYVYFKLFIEEPGQDTVVQIFLKVICLEDDSVFYDKYILHHLEADTYACWNGIGFNQKGKWKAGLYKYSLRVGTGSVYEGTFTVY